ncbi:MAG: hypothetical protein SGPRY_006094 [Prymnesium sp.]
MQAGKLPHQHIFDDGYIQTPSCLVQEEREGLKAHGIQVVEERNVDAARSRLQVSRESSNTFSGVHL